jgi:hypothetical protein
MQHIRAELLRCESELRFLQSQESDPGVDYWKRAVYFFSALKAPTFLMGRLVAGDVSELFRNKITAILSKIGVEISGTQMYIDWTMGAEEFKIRVYQELISGRTFTPTLYQWTEHTKSQKEWIKENSRTLDEKALRDLMWRIMCTFDSRDGKDMAERLVANLYGPPRDVQDASDMWARISVFFELLADKQLKMSGVSNSDSLNESIGAALKKLDFEFGKSEAKWIELKFSVMLKRSESLVSADAIGIRCSHAMSTGIMGFTGRTWTEQPGYNGQINSSQSLVSFMSHLLTFIDDKLPPTAAQYLVNAYYGKCAAV